MIYGKGEQVTGIDAVSNADVTFVPSYDGWSDIGREIGAAGDVDGDGYDDFYIGEPGDADNRTKVYLFHGGPEKLSGELGFFMQARYSPAPNASPLRTRAVLVTSTETATPTLPSGRSTRARKRSFSSWVENDGMSDPSR